MENETKEKMQTTKLHLKRKLRKLLTLLIAVTIGFSCGVATCIIKPWKNSPIVLNADNLIQGENYILTISTVEEVVKPASDLITTKYCYKDADTYENYKQLFGKKIPLTTDKVVFTYDGTIHLGLDLSAVSYDIDNEEQVITITLPEITVISNEIDAESFEYPYIEDSVFNATDMSDYTALIADLKERKEEAVLQDAEYMESAKENAQNVLKGFLTAADATKEYTVTFK